MIPTWIIYFQWNENCLTFPSGEGPITDMEVTLWTELIRQAPALAVVVYLVIQFLRFLKDNQVTESARTERMACALDKNTELFGRVAACLMQSEINNNRLTKATGEK